MASTKPECWGCGARSGPRRAVQRIIPYGAECSLLFIIGASGSGKSSLARARLLPTHEAYYATLGYTPHLIEDELKAAIQQSLRQLPDAAGEQFKPALLDQLASDAAGDPAYLPLLQVTMEDL